MENQEDKCRSNHICSGMRTCIKRALEIHINGNISSAKMSFISDIKKYECTKTIKMSPFIILKLLESVEDDFEKFKEFL